MDYRFIDFIVWEEILLFLSSREINEENKKTDTIKTTMIDKLECYHMKKIDHFNNYTVTTNIE